MRIDGLFGYLYNRLRALGACKRGNVMFTFALATLPIVGFVGAAVDYSRGNSAKVAMQAAIDATGLMLSKEAEKLTQAQLTQKANDAFLALFNRPEVTNLVITPAFSTPTTSSFKLVLDVTGKVNTTFTQVLGHDHMDLSVTTEVVWGVKKLELALALDVTGSMASNNKMTELKKAAKSLLTTLKNAAKVDGDIRVAIAPFAVNVNVGTTNANASWLDWSAWSSEPVRLVDPANPTAGWIANNQLTWSRTGPGSSCPFTNNTHGFRCTAGPASVSNDTVVSTVPATTTYAGISYEGLICPSRDNGGESTTATGLLTNSYHNGCYTSVEKDPADWYTVSTGWSASCGSNPNCTCSGSGGSKVCKQKTYTHTWRPLAKTEWNGCVRDRNQTYDASNAAPSFASTLESKTNMAGVAENYRTATTPSLADAFQPHQFNACPATLLPLTYDWTALNNKVDELQPTGNTNVTIGLSWAFHALTASDPMANALPPGPGLDKVIILLTDGDNTQNRWTGNQADIDARTTATCAAVKTANIKMYTIRVINGNASLLQACATNPDMYYNVQNASDLNAVFVTIAQNLANLRLAK
jgi:Flp pilus assembly protein TadG